MNLRSIVKELQRELGGGFHVVGQPDHPMLLSGPDILIGGNGKLTGVFWLSKRESVNSLLARITAARLALPLATRLLAVVATNTEVTDRVVRNFDETIALRAWRSLLNYASSDAPLRGDREALQENKRQHSERFAFALLLANLRRRHTLEIVPPDVVIRDLTQANRESTGYSQPSLGLRRPTAEVQGSIVTSLSPRGRPFRQLRSFCNAGFTSIYELDNGIPYQKPNVGLNVLLVEDWPTVRYDPEKPLRTAAFGGWIMAESTDASDITNLIERMREPRNIRKWWNA